MIYIRHLKKQLKKNGPFAVRAVIEVALVKYPKSKLVFLNIVNAVGESGKLKLPKYIKKMLSEIKDELPHVVNIFSQMLLLLIPPIS